MKGFLCKNYNPQRDPAAPGQTPFLGRNFSGNSARPGGSTRLYGCIQGLMHREFAARALKAIWPSFCCFVVFCAGF